LPPDERLPRATATVVPELVSLDELERVDARRIVEYFQGNKARVAEILGQSRAALYRVFGPKGPPSDSAE
jgi:DNA-binding protein Fis